MRCEHCQGIRHRWSAEIQRFVKCPVCKGAGHMGETEQAAPVQINTEAADNLPFTKRRA